MQARKRLRPKTLITGQRLHEALAQQACRNTLWFCVLLQQYTLLAGDRRWSSLGEVYLALTT